MNNNANGNANGRANFNANANANVRVNVVANVNVNTNVNANENPLAIPAEVCYTGKAVNEGGCLKGETMNRQPSQMVNPQGQPNQMKTVMPQATLAAKPNNQKITAAYERLSRDDEQVKLRIKNKLLNFCERASGKRKA